MPTKKRANAHITVPIGDNGPPQRTNKLLNLLNHYEPPGPPESSLHADLVPCIFLGKYPARGPNSAPPTKEGCSGGVLSTMTAPHDVGMSKLEHKKNGLHVDLPE